MMFDRLMKWWGQRPSEGRPSDAADFWYRDVASPSESGVVVTDDKALAVATFFACLRVLSQSIASMPLLVYRRLDDGGKQRAVDSDWYEVLHERPNSWQTPAEWKQLGMAWLILRGNWYCRIIRGLGVRRTELLPLHPDRMQVKQRPDGQLDYYYRPNAGQTIPYAARDILHVRGLSLDGVVGVSVLTYARNAVGLSSAQEAHGSRLFANGSLPPFALETPEPMNERAIGNFRAGWRGMHAGARNAHNPPILQGGMKIHELSLTNEDSQWLESRKFQAEEICRFTGVPPHMAGILDRATFCMPRDVEVLTEFGPKSIAEVRAEDRVWSLGGDDGMQLSRVIRSDCTGIDDILRISTTNRTVRANAKHRFLVRRKYPVPKPGVGGYQSVEWRSEWVPAGDLRVGDTLILADRLPAEGTTQLATRTASLNFVELCGLILGDGNVFKGRGVSIARAANAGYMDHYRGVMRREFYKTRDGGKGLACRRQLAPITLTEGQRQTRFSSVLAAEELQSLGLCGNARTKRVPQWVFTLPEGFRLGFLRGFLDADGSVDRKGRIAYHSVNEVMLSQIRHLCIGCGIPVTNMRCQEGVTTLPNGKRQAFKICTFTCSDPGENRRIGSHDPRYVVRLASGVPFDRKGRKYPRYGGAGFKASGCTLARINAIEQEPPEPVYDLEVEDTHSFIANGVVVHNSNIEHQGIDYVRYTLRPWATLWQQAAKRDLIWEPDLFAEFLLDDLQRGDTPSRYGAYNVGLQSGFLTRNEVRSWENLNPIEGGDTPLEPLNMGPIGQRDARQEATPESTPEPPRQPDDDEQPRKRKTRRGRTRESRLRRAFLPLLRDAGQRIAAAECKGLASRAGKAADDPDRWRIWASEWYEGHVAYAVRALQPLADAWREQTGRRLAVGEVCGRLRDDALRELRERDPQQVLREWKEIRAQHTAAWLERELL